MVQAKSWAEYRNFIEVRVAQELIGAFQKYDDPRSQEAVRRLQQDSEKRSRASLDKKEVMLKEINPWVKNNL